MNRVKMLKKEKETDYEENSGIAFGSLAAGCLHSLWLGTGKTNGAYHRADYRAYQGDYHRELC
jgi:hypothetical protein